ncbi:hypothetical protein KVD76_04915 [Helicobacter pylori]|nr:hypothetical protein KVD76_04915 [Helicobacter pylori]
MKNILGKHYEGHKIVSAQAAFYGLSSALLPENDFYKKKQKFLDFFKAEESLLLYKCRFQQLGEFITEELLENSRKKIIESNCNKALRVIEKLQKAIATTIERQINPTIKEIKDRQKETYSNLDRSGDTFVSNLRKSAFDAIERFKTDLSKKMHEHIDRDIEDDECQRKFEVELQQGMEKLDEDMKRRFEQDGEQFCKDTQKDAKQFEDRIKNSLENLKRINIDSGFDFDLNLNIPSGIDKLGLSVSIGGLLLLLLFPASVWLVFFGVITGLSGAIKAVWKIWSSSYKKSAQKEAIEDKLKLIFYILIEGKRDKEGKEEIKGINSQLEDAKLGIFENVEKIKVGFNDPVVRYERMREGLIKTGEGLWHLSNNIKTRIAQ